MSVCFHCGETVPKGSNLTTLINEVEQPMCCVGCQAVALFLTDHEHEVFYQYRQNKRPDEQVKTENQAWNHLDVPDVFSELTKQNDDHSYQITLKVEGMYCSACGWLLQKVLLNRPGILDVRINTVTQNLQLDFNVGEIKLSEIFNQVQTLGYQPLQQNNTYDDGVSDNKQQLKKIAVAGFGMMFIMTLAVPLYSPETFKVTPHIQRFFLMISLLIATLVYFYSGTGFVQNAIRDLKNKHLGMDVPVALSISLAYFVSLYLSFTQQGHVYFDSMSMFVFFLLIGRYVESQVRHQGMNVRESLFALVPVSAERICSNNKESEIVPLNQINKGDEIRVTAGQVIPCDGQVLHGNAEINEAILTGESQLINKQKPDQIYAGSSVISGELRYVTTVNNQDSFLAKLADLMELAQSKKPASLQSVDQIASYFVAVVLILAVGTALWYGLHQNDALMTALLSVLIATCPCALSLATPTALTAAGVNLLHQGVLVNNTQAITQLGHIDHWFFDKTGTLTEDKLTVKTCHQIDQSRNFDDVASGLQQISNHPISTAFQTHVSNPATDAKEHSGLGVSGTINGHEYHMGSRIWMQSMGFDLPQWETDPMSTPVYLAQDHQIVALYELQVPKRAGTAELLSELKAQGKTPAIISGDQTSTVNSWGKQLQINNCQGELRANDKINVIANLQQQGQSCVMVGDGINDAPVLSQADVSISLKQGAYLAHAASDMIILGKSLSPLIAAIKISKKSNTIIKQNLLWSLVYNLSVTPIAMMGLLAPWMAAIGMSLSSLLVVLNSRRLLKQE